MLFILLYILDFGRTKRKTNIIKMVLVFYLSSKILSINDISITYYACVKSVLEHGTLVRRNLLKIFEKLHRK